MRVLKVIHGYPPDYQAGSEVYSQAVVHGLAARDHEVVVFTRTENPYQSDYHVSIKMLDLGVKLFQVNMAREKDGFAHAELDRTFGQLLVELRPDVVHFGHLNHLSTGLVQVAKAAGLPVVFTLHDFWLLCPRGQFLQTNFAQAQPYQLCDGQAHQKCARNCYAAYFTAPESESCLNYWTDWVRQRMAATDAVLEEIDVLFAPSDYLAQCFIAQRPQLKDKIQVLRYGFPWANLHPTRRMPGKSPYTFGYIGTHIPAKGVNLLIEAFAALDRPARLLIWGRENNPSSRALRELAAGLPIEFRGEYCNRDIADEVFDSIDCLVVPSIWMENAPLVIQEAQQCRVPVITADVGGMAELVAHRINGLLFRHRNTSSLTQELRYAVDHPEELRRYGQRGFLHSSTGDVVSLEEHIDQLQTVYQSLLLHAINR
jgi:glycosyltransferase involved in cell wall biosynthesis